MRTMEVKVENTVKTEKKLNDIKNQGNSKVAYYPGCSLNSTAIDFNQSIKKLFKVLEIGLEEIEDWNCCGTTPAANVSHEIPVFLSARNTGIS